jgi:hypothetical protein
MFGSNVFDVAIGLCFVFLLLSLICSSANELIEMKLKNRAADLEKGISELLGDPEKTKEFLAAIYNHGLINSLYPGRYPSSAERPSYIPAENFALAILSVREQWKKEGTALPENVASALAALETTAGSDVKKLQASVETWYNSAMDRVSGWYKRRSQKFILVMGFVVAIAVNADCISIAQGLSNDSSLRQGVVAMAEVTAKETPTNGGSAKPGAAIKDDIKTLDSLGLPVGWRAQDNANLGFGGWLQRILGWFLTALAISLGAPFWFDMLNKIIVVRSTVRPHEKSGEEASKDPVKTTAATA